MARSFTLVERCSANKRGTFKEWGGGRREGGRGSWAVTPEQWFWILDYLYWQSFSSFTVSWNYDLLLACHALGEQSVRGRNNPRPGLVRGGVHCPSAHGALLYTVNTVACVLHQQSLFLCLPSLPAWEPLSGRASPFLCIPASRVESATRWGLGAYLLSSTCFRRPGFKYLLCDLGQWLKMN